MPLNILLLRTWSTNIGNQIIEAGARVCLSTCFPGANLIDASGLPDHLDYYRKSLYRGAHPNESRSNQLSIREKKADEDSSVVNIATLLEDVDIVVLPGCTLDFTLDKLFRTLKSLSRKRIPLVLLGAGGIDYDQSTCSKVREILDELHPSAIITRDSSAFEAYSDMFEFAFKGIDCGFFVNEWYSPPKVSNPFVVLAFDSMREPIIETKWRIIRACHSALAFTYVENPLFNFCSKHLGLGSGRSLKRKGLLLSDLVTDYLFLYANAREVHSDRIHACVAALSYGNPARLYSHTARAELFDGIVTGDINNELVDVDSKKLDEQKKRHLESVKEAFRTLVRRAG